MADSDRRLMIELGVEIDQLKRDFDQAKSMTENYADFALKQDDRIEKAKTESSNKSADQIRRINEKAKSDLKKQYEAAKTAAKGNSQELLRLKRDYQKNVLKLEAQTNKQINQSRNKFLRESENKLAQATLLNRRKIKKQIIADLKNRYEKEKKLARGNADEVRKIEKRLTQDINRIRSSTKSRRSGSGGGGARGGGGGLGGMTETLGKVKAGWLAVGVAVAGVVAWVGDAVKEYQKFEKVGLKVKTLLNDTQAQALPLAMADIQKIALKTGETVDKLGESLYNTISAVPALANNMGAATSLVEKAAKSAVGLGTDTNSVVDAMTNLANASGLSLETTENQTFVLDRMSMALKQGKISGDQMASSIAKSAPVMRSVSSSAEGTIEAIAAMTAQMTASGISSDESATQIKSLAAEFSDSAKMSKLLAAGLKGVNEEGKVSSWSDVIKSMGQDTQKFTSILGSLEAKNAVLTLSKEGGKAFGDLMVSMNNAGGTAEQMYNTMSVSSEMATKRQEAAAQVAKIKVGAVFNDIANQFSGMSTSFWASVGGLFETSEEKFRTSSNNLKEHMGTLTGVREISAGLNETMSKFGEGGIEGQIALSNGLEDVRSKFNSLEGVPEYYRENIEGLLGMEENRTADTIDQIFGKIQGFEGVPPEVQQAISDIIDKEGKTPESLAKIQETITNMGGVPEGLATGIDQIINNQSQATVDNINKLAEQMGKLEQISGSQVFVEAANAASLSLDALSGKMENIKDDLVHKGDVWVASWDLSDMLAVTSEQMKNIATETAEIDAKMGDINVTEQEKVELTQRLSELNSQQMLVSSSRSQTELAIRDGITQQVEAAKAYAIKNNEILDVDKAILLAKHDVTKELGAEGETLDYINSIGMEIRENTVQSGIAEAEKAGNMELTTQLKQSELNHQIELLKTDQERLEANSDLYIGGEDYTNTLSNQIDSQIEILEKQRDGLDANEENLDVSDDTLSTLEDTNDVLSDSADLKAEQVDLGYEDDDLTQAINDKINDRLGSQSDSVQLQIDRLIGLSDETIVQMTLLRTEQQRAATLIQMSKAAGFAVTAMEEAYKKGQAKLAALSGLAQATGKKIMDMQSKQKARKAVGYKGKSSRGGGGRKKSGKSKANKDKEKAQKKAQKEADKARKDGLKMEKKLQKDREKAQKEALKAEEKARKERQKKEEEAFKRSLDLIERKNKKDLDIEKARIEEANRLQAHAKAIKAAEDKIREDLKEFSKNIAAQNREFIKGSVSAISELLKPFSSEAQKIMEGINTVITSAAKDTAKKLKDIDKYTKQGSEAGAKLRKVTFELEALNTDPTNKALTDTKKALEDLVQANKDLKDEKSKAATAETAYLTDLGKYNAGVKSLNDELSSLGFQISSVAGSGSSGSAELQQKADSLKSSIDDLSKSVTNNGKKSAKNQDELVSLEDTMSKMGIIARANAFEYKGLTYKYKNYGQAVTKAKEALEKYKDVNKLTGSAVSNTSSKESELRQKYRDTKKELNGLIKPTNAYNKTQQSYGEEIGSNLETIGSYEESLLALNNTNGKNSKRLTQLTEDQIKYNSIITLSKGKIDELQKTIDKTKGKKFSTQTAKGMIKQFEGVAFGLSKIGDKYQQVIDIQNEGIANLDNAQFVEKFDSALGVLENINKDFEIFGINASKLLKKAGEVGSLSAKDIQELLGNLEGQERANAEILLKSAMGIFELQFKIKDGIIKQNNLLREQMGIYREALVTQADYASTVSNSMAFIESYNVKDLNHVEKLNQGYQKNLLNIQTQLEAFEKGRVAQLEILDGSKRQAESLGNELQLKERLIELTRKEIKETRESDLPEAEKAGKLESLTKELTVQKNAYDVTNKALTGYNKKIAESKKIIDDSTDSTRKLTDTGKNLTESFKKNKPIEQRKKDIDDMNKMFAEAGDDITKTMKAISKAFELGETKKGMEELSKVINGVVGDMENMYNFAKEMMAGGVSIEDAFSSGDVGAGVAGIGDLTMKIGKALLGAGFPLDIAGAVILGMGLITKMVGEAISFIIGKQETSLEKAQSKSNELERHVKFYDAQIERLKILEELEDSSVDTAQERLDILRAQIKELAKKNAYVKKYLDMDAQGLAAVKAIGKTNEDNLNKEKATMESMKGLGQIRKGDILEELGYDRNMFGWIITDAEIDSLIAGVDEALLEVTDSMEAVDIVVDYKKQDLAELKNLFDEQVSRMDWNIKASIELKDFDAALDIVNQKTTKIKDLITKNFAGLDLGFNLKATDLEDEESINKLIQSLSGMNVPPEVFEMLDGLKELYKEPLAIKTGEIDSQVDLINKKIAAGIITEKDGLASILSLYNDKIALLKEDGDSESEMLDTIIARNAVVEQMQDNLSDSRLKLLEHDKKHIDYLVKIGELTEKEADIEYEKLLTDKLFVNNEILNTLIDQKAGVDAINAAEEALWATQIEIYDLKHKDSKLDDEQLEKAKELNRQRNMMVTSYKQGGGEFTMADIQKIENQIIEQLRIAGASEEQIKNQIQTFRATVPTFETGGRTTEGLAQVHDEMIIGVDSTKQLDKMYPGFLDTLNSDPLKAFQDLWMGYQASLMDKEQARSELNQFYTDVGGINIYNTIAGKMDTGEVQKMTSAISVQMQREFQGKGIQLTGL